MARLRPSPFCRLQQFWRGGNQGGDRIDHRNSGDFDQPAAEAELGVPVGGASVRQLTDGAGLAKTRLQLLPSTGSYFQCVDYSGIANDAGRLPEAEFCLWLTREVGVAAIPLSAFYHDSTDITDPTQRMIASIRMTADTESLNASVAAGIALYAIAEAR